jgi:hypothetical protein
MFKSVILFLLSLGLTITVFGQDSTAQKKITIKGYSKTQTINCNGEEVVILGDYHKITITGHCWHLAVYADKCTIKMETAGLISLHGNDNKVTYKVNPERKTTVSRYGDDNQVTKIE